MVCVLIYKTTSQHYSFVVVEDRFYDAIKKEMSSFGEEVLWKKENVNIQQIESSRKTKDNLVARLNDGQSVDLEKELSVFFK